MHESVIAFSLLRINQRHPTRQEQRRNTYIQTKQTRVSRGTPVKMATTFFGLSRNISKFLIEKRIGFQVRKRTQIYIGKSKLKKKKNRTKSKQK